MTEKRTAGKAADYPRPAWRSRRAQSNRYPDSGHPAPLPPSRLCKQPVALKASNPSQWRNRPRFPRGSQTLNCEQCNRREPAAISKSAPSFARSGDFSKKKLPKKTPEILAAAGGWGATHFFVAAGVSRIICLRRAFEKRRPTREFEPTPVEKQRPLSAQKRLDGRPCGRAENGRAVLPRRPDLILVSV